MNPDVVIVNGTRIIAGKILNCVDSVFVNTHAGITPKYRGVHGAYWALANDDYENCGVTVHLVDTGIDTGGILRQKNIEIKGSDNFTTYTLLQIAEGIDLMRESLSDILTNNISLLNVRGRSELWSHPTIWGYLFLRLARGVK